MTLKAVTNVGGDRMNSMDLVPRFIEPGDDQGESLALPLYVSRQVDDEIRRAQEARKRLLTAAVQQQQRTDTLKKAERAKNNARSTVKKRLRTEKERQAQRVKSAEQAGKIGEVGLPAPFTACPFACGSRESFAAAKRVETFTVGWCVVMAATYYICDTKLIRFCWIKPWFCMTNVLHP